MATMEVDRFCVEHCTGDIEKLTSLRNSVRWDVKGECRRFYHRLSQFKYWRGPLPNLREIFTRAEMEWLLAKDAKCSRFNENKKAPLVEFAVLAGYEDEPELDQNGKPIWRRSTALLHATHNDCFDAVHHLFKIYTRFDVNYADDIGFSHFHAACQTRHWNIVKKFLDHGQDPNCFKESTDVCIIAPPLYWAALRGHSPTFKLLLDHGADPNLYDKYGHTPLHTIALRPGDLWRMAEMLFKYGQEPVMIDSQDEEGMTPLMTAIDLENYKLAEMLLERGANPTFIDWNGSTALHYMCAGCAIDAVYANLIDLLVRNGADPNVADEKGETAMHIVCQKNGDSEFLAEILVNTFARANKLVLVDQRDLLGNTPLHFAVEHENDRLIQFLLRRGADPNAANNNGLTPLHLICQREDDDDLLHIFLTTCDEENMTVRFHPIDVTGRTPLQCATERVLTRVVGMLVRRGADASRVAFPSLDHFAAACYE